MHLSRDSSILTLASLRDFTKQVGNEVLCIFFKYITTHYFLINFRLIMQLKILSKKKCMNNVSKMQKA